MSLEEPTPHHRRTSFDHLLEAPIQDGSDDSEANDDTEPLLNTPPQPRLAHTPTPGQQRRAQLLRYLALLFACLLRYIPICVFSRRLANLLFIQRWEPLVRTTSAYEPSIS